MTSYTHSTFTVNADLNLSVATCLLLVSFLAPVVKGKCSGVINRPQGLPGLEGPPGPPGVKRIQDGKLVVQCTPGGGGQRVGRASLVYAGRTAVTK